MARRRGHRPALRLVSILGLFAVTFAAIGSKLVYLQVVQAAPLENLGEQQRVRATALPAKRGAIYDRDMSPLAISTDARAIYAEPRALAALTPPIDLAMMADKLAPVLGVSAGFLRDQLRKDTNFAYLARRVPPSVAGRVLALRLPHVLALKETRRSYPSDDLAGQILGFVNVDNLGLSGIESAYNQLLSGTPGEQVIERDPQGRPIPHGRSQTVEPVDGRGVVLTIDRDLQYMAEDALGRGARAVDADAGVAIVVNPRTGEILAMANWPPLNPNDFGDATSDERRNRAVTDVYEPGSVNKVITASAAIESGVAAPGTILTIPDHIRIANKTFTDFDSHPTEHLTYGEGLARSSNIATIKVAARVGRQRLYDALVRFGVGQPTGIGFPGESGGILADVGDWWPTSMGTIPIGQGIALTPLQVATVYATIANDGVRVAPRLVRGTVATDGSLVPSAAPERRRVVSPFTAAQVRGMLTAVVQHGTGTMAQIPGYLVGGKTGTARVPRTDRLGYSNDIITTFAGMAPADDPRLVVMVQLHNPSIRYAATTAAPVFREIMRFALGARGIAPTVGLADTEALSLRRAVAPPPPKRKHHDRRDPLARVETVAEAPPARAGPEEAAKQP